MIAISRQSLRGRTSRQGAEIRLPSLPDHVRYRARFRWRWSSSAIASVGIDRGHPVVPQREPGVGGERQAERGRHEHGRGERQQP
jgi:hypothetical protein